MTVNQLLKQRNQGGTVQDCCNTEPRTRNPSLISLFSGRIGKNCHATQGLGYEDASEANVRGR